MKIRVDINTGMEVEIILHQTIAVRTLVIVGGMKVFKKVKINQYKHLVEIQTTTKSEIKHLNKEQSLKQYEMGIQPLN